MCAPSCSRLCEPSSQTGRRYGFTWGWTWDGTQLTKAEEGIYRGQNIDMTFGDNGDVGFKMFTERDNWGVYYAMTDDAPGLCSHYYCSAAAAAERTEVYVVPQREFTVWLEVEKTMPDEGVKLHDSPPESGKKAV